MNPIHDAPPEERELQLSMWNVRTHLDQVGVMALDFNGLIATLRSIQAQRDALIRIREVA